MNNWRYYLWEVNGKKFITELLGGYNEHLSYIQEYLFPNKAVIGYGERFRFDPTQTEYEIY